MVRKKKALLLLLVALLVSSCIDEIIEKKNNARPLSLDEVNEIAANITIPQMLYRAERDNLDPNIVNGIYAGKPFVTWNLRYSTKEIFPTAWTIQIFNSENKYIAMQNVNIYTGKNSTGLGPRDDLHPYLFEFPKDITHIRDYAWAKFRVKITENDFKRAILMKFWDARQYWIFPIGEDSHPRVQEFNIAKTNLHEIHTDDEQEKYYMLPVNQYRISSKESPNNTVGILESLSAMINKVKRGTIVIP